MSAAVQDSAVPALYLAPVPVSPAPRKRGRPRKGTTIEGPVPVIQEKAVVLSAYQRAVRKVESGCRNQCSVALTHSETQALSYGLRRLAQIAKECSGSSELNGTSC